MPKINAKGRPKGGYWAYGKHWPDIVAVEHEVREHEVELIMADPNLIVVTEPEPVLCAKCKEPLAAKDEQLPPKSQTTPKAK
jgi:hypothetical protein